MAKNPMFSLNILMIGTRATGKTTYLTCTYGRSSDGALFDDGKCKVTLDLANEGSNVSQKSVAKINKYWRDLKSNKSSIMGTQMERFQYPFIMKYQNKSFFTGDTHPLPLLKLNWTDARGGSYDALTLDDANGKRYLIDALKNDIRDKKYNAIMVFCKWEDVLFESSQTDKKNEIDRLEFINIIKSIVELKSAYASLPIVLIVTHGAEEIANEKNLSLRSPAVKEQTELLYDRKEQIRNVLTRIANDYGRASLNFPVFFVDSVLSARFSPEFIENVGLDGVRKPMISILGQCADIITDVIFSVERRPKSQSVKRQERIKSFFVRPETDRLIEAFRKARAIMGMV
ncbi:MAG: hypothetical protein J6A99_03640 [Clostridia bacterium]|nr:hypothetical protein [Clostridia bacterium]